jgi:hypothetical protein
VIAALYVDPNGAYAGLPDVDLWDESRDARLYQGPHAVVAHPPCSSWCQLAPINRKRYGHKVGDDGGCFAAALASVRRWGGVLEHPANSYAWPAHDLMTPSRAGWVRDIYGGWSCAVYQGHYEHDAAKGTWLYAFGVTYLPIFTWGKAAGKALVSWCNNHGTQHDERPRIGKKAAAATPPPFRDLLLSIARSVPRE